jgi:hypothetical protein
VLGFALYLARTLGCTLEELMGRMSAYEFWLHVADYKRRRFGGPEMAAPEEDPMNFVNQVNAWRPQH